MSDRYVKISECIIGDDSKSGDAFRCEIEGESYWVPYSQCRRRSVSKFKGRDSIEVASWWATRNEIEGEPC